MRVYLRPNYIALCVHDTGRIRVLFLGFLLYLFQSLISFAFARFPQTNAGQYNEENYQVAYALSRVLRYIVGIEVISSVRK